MISKKDLLRETGISYGQLYRWKRAGLIPEEWFVKKSSFTGQETFLPREKILERVKTILELKDEKSFEEMEKIFYPEVWKRKLTRGELEDVEGLDGELLKIAEDMCSGSQFDYMKAVFAICFSEAMRSTPLLSLADTEELFRGVKAHADTIKSTAYTMCICKKRESCFAVIYKEDEELLWGNDVETLFSIKLEEASKKIK